MDNPDHSSRPRTREEYRAWWEQNTTAPYGFCWCGCGQATEIATKTNRKALQFAGEPKRFVGYHGSKGYCNFTAEDYRLWWKSSTDVPYGYCWCGCGERTVLADQSNSKRYRVAGEPQPYLRGHHFRRSMPDPDFGCNQNGGYCECGCGELAPVIPYTNRRHGLVKGRRYRFVRNHNKRGTSEKPKGLWTTQRYSKGAVRGSHTDVDIMLMYRDQGGRCAYCEVPLRRKFQVDHMTPVSRGGSDDVENLAIACPSCNRRKHTKTAEEFMALLL